MKPLPAIIASVVLLCVAAFCAFGFLASFEPSNPPWLHLAFRVGYAVLGIGCVGGMVAVIVKALRQ